MQSVNANDSPTPNPCWRRISIVPSFFVACLVTVSTWLAFLFWIVVDAQYGQTLFVVRHLTGIASVERDPSYVPLQLWDMMWDGVRGWDALGPRLLLFGSLAALAVVSAVVALAQFFRQLTLRRMFMLVFMIAAWLSIWTGYGQVNEWSVVRRANSELPRFASVAERLIDQWPTANGTMLETGEYYAQPIERPDHLWLRGGGYAIREGFGHEIERSNAGAIRFTLNGATGYQIEFHPTGSVPSSYTTSNEAPLQMRDAIPLDIDGWFLVRYADI